MDRRNQTESRDDEAWPHALDRWIFSDDPVTEERLSAALASSSRLEPAAD
ncbi:hypothetical protein [Hamadaea tsunoensis]|nr:hypothetical protein [Hamadaea tsunoensis]